MNRYTIAIAAALAVVLGVFLVLRQRQDSYQWQQVNAPDGTFSIAFPAQPVEGPGASSTGGPTAHSLNVRASADAAYGCSWWDDPKMTPQSVDMVLDRARDLGLAGAQVQLVRENKVTVHGHPAREIVASAGGLTYDNRLVVVGNRIYSLIVIQRRGTRNLANILKFFDSFTPIEPSTRER